MKHSISSNRVCSLTEFADRLVGLLPRLADEVISRERNYFSRGLITLPQVRALRALSEGNACAMGDLARLLSLKASTVTGLVDRLVKLGLVRRIRSSEDRRAVLAAISPKGRRILAHLYDENRKSVMSLFGNITGRERAVYLDIIEKIVGRLSVEK